MINSMTGFGSACVEGDLGVFAIEIKSVNHRFLDLSFRLSGNLSFMERDIRKIIASTVKRGRIEVNIRWTRKGTSLPTLEINASLLEKLYKDALSIQKRLEKNGAVSIRDLLHVPALYIETPAPLGEKIVQMEVKKGLKKALRALQRTRRQEGAHLAGELRVHLDGLEQNRRKIVGLKDEVLEKYRLRLLKKIEQFNLSAQSPIDEQRLDAEVLLYADKSDITEELARLESHITAFRGYIESEGDEPVGRPLDFLCQEILREVNTIGSKSRDTALANQVLAMKNVVEKIREQVQNIE